MSHCLDLKTCNLQPSLGLILTLFTWYRIILSEIYKYSSIILCISDIIIIWGGMTTHLMMIISFFFNQDMNEPANFGTNEEKPWNWPEGKEPWSLQCPESTLDDPPFRTSELSCTCNLTHRDWKNTCMRIRYVSSIILREWTPFFTHTWCFHR